MELDEKQAQVVACLRGQPAGLIGAGMGTGKTLVGSYAALQEKAETVLVVCPLGTRTGWERHFRALGYKGDIVRLQSGAKGLKERFEDLKNGKPGVYLVGWEYLVRQKNVMWAKIKPDVVIGDECHRASNRKTGSFREYKRLKPKKQKLSMSGTWFGNSFQGAWAVARALWPDLIDLSFWRWAEQWCEVVNECLVCFEAVEDGWTEKHCPTCYNALETHKRVLGEKNPGAFAASLPAYFTWEAPDTGEDHWKQEPLQHTLYAEMSAKHRKVYNQMEKQLLAWVDNQPIVASIPITKSIRLRQIALGLPTINEDDEVAFADDCESSKIDVIREFLEGDPDRSVAVGTDSKKFADVLAKRLEDLGDVYLWTGDVNQAKREAIVQEWGTPPKRRRILVAVIAALGEGVDGLQHYCSTVIWANKGRDGIKNDQFFGRWKRRGQPERVTEITVVAVDTVEDPDHARLEEALIARGLSMGEENI